MDYARTEFVVERWPAGLVGQLALVLALFLAAGACLYSSVTWLRKARSNDLARLSSIGSGMFTVIGLVGLFFGSWNLLVKQGDLVRRYKSGAYEKFEGCLNGFSPSPIRGHTPDVIQIDTRILSYTDYNNNGGFHTTEALGGPIRADSWVRLFVIGDVIVRVDARDHACPPAPPVAR